MVVRDGLNKASSTAEDALCFAIPLFLPGRTYKKWIYLVGPDGFTRNPFLPSYGRFSFQFLYTVPSWHRMNANLHRR
jgi:hypothetical protein